SKKDKYVEAFYQMRQREGITRVKAEKILKTRNYFGSMMVQTGDADCLVSGVNMSYIDTIRPALQVVKVNPEYKIVSGLYMMIFENDVMFFADPTVNIEPDSEELAEIAINTAKSVRQLGVEPKVAMLSFSDFGSNQHPLSEKVKKAVEIVIEKMPDLTIDGEMQADTAVVSEILNSTYPFSHLKEKANVLIFPDLQSGNIAYKLLERLSEAKAVGPILIGMNKPIHVLQRGASVDDIVNLSAIAVVDAQNSD
ncbi:MAG: NADP-dependent malic enzyme, partial [Candidatus Aminicenantes bacterium]|nr:NADP-dependent malic enzyme [Candidatus Aminicenantes bacterium]